MEALSKILNSEENYKFIIKSIREYINVSNNSIRKYIDFIKSLTSKYMKLLVRYPNNKQEIKLLIQEIDSRIISDIIKYVSLNYPDKIKDKMENGLDSRIDNDAELFGNTNNMVSMRPKNTNNVNKKKSQGSMMTDTDTGTETFGKALQPDSMIEKAKKAMAQMNGNLYISDHKLKDEEFMNNYENYKASRDIETYGGLNMMGQRPPTPDFSLDGSGKKKKKNNNQESDMAYNQNNQGGYNMQNMGYNNMQNFGYNQQSGYDNNNYMNNNQQYMNYNQQQMGSGGWNNISSYDDGGDFYASKLA